LECYKDILTEFILTDILTENILTDQTGHILEENVRTDQTNYDKARLENNMSAGTRERRKRYR
jgi:hypothetical protein